MSLKKVFAALIIILVAIGGFVAGMYLLREKQDIGEQAAVPGGKATVTFVPDSGTYKVGDTIQVGIYFNTDNIAVSGIAVRAKYSFLGSTPEVTVSAININPTLLSSGDWTCPTQTSFQQGNEVIIDFACANTTSSGYSTNQDTLLSTISLKVQRTPSVSPLVVRFDPAESIITKRSDNQDILLIPTSEGKYTIEGATGITETPTPTSKLSGTVTPTKKVTSTPTPTVKTTGTITGTRTPTPTTAQLPDAGVSTPTIMGVVFGALVITASILLAL